MKQNEILNTLKNKKVQWGIAIVLFIIILYVTASFRFGSWNNLDDQLTGEKLTSDPDALYFLRIAETLDQNGGHLPAFDDMRYSPASQTAWHPEILPNIVYYMHKLMPSYSIAEVDVASPVIFFIIGAIIFFILISFITDKKTAILASAFLGVVPAYIFRSTAGSADHDILGMLSLFLAFLIYVLSLKYVIEKKKIYYPILGGILTGFATTLVIVTWGGIAKAAYIILPISFFMLWIFKTKNSKDFAIKGLVFYTLFILFSAICGIIFRYSPMSIFNSNLITSQGILSLAVLAFIIVDAVLIYYHQKFKIKEKYRIVYSLAATIILGIIGLTLIGKNIFSIISSIISSFLAPFGEGRFGVTVAENQAPFLSDWINQTGSVLFWLFILGVFYFGFELSKSIKNFKRKIIFVIAYVLMTSGIIFSKYSPASIFNGTNFISAMFYFIPLVFFWGYFFWLYFKEDFSFNYIQTFIFGWMFFTIISGRAAARMFFAITPFVCFMGAYFVFSLFKLRKNRDEVLRVVAIILFIISIISSVYFIGTAYTASVQTVKYTGPVADLQWQKAMYWTKTNTSADSVFAHWWDYGYLVQGVGDRRTIADGGQFQGAEIGNHMLGRYVLTTPNPDTALSYFKTMNVDYLLIDPTDLGKYPAYSRIGSDTNWDRYGMLAVGAIDPTQVIETKNGTTSLYRVNGAVDQDISYNINGADIFLPGPTYNQYGNPSYKAGIGGIILTTVGTQVSIPEGIFYYNGQQYKIPIRYLYIDGKIHDFGTGINATAMLIPAVQTSNTGSIINQIGGIIYMSPKVSQSLYAELYLMNDPFNEYPTIKLAHIEEDQVVTSIKADGNNLSSEFLYYNGFRGPIKIWNTEDIPSNIQNRSEFYKSLNINFGGLDNLEFSEFVNSKTI